MEAQIESRESGPAWMDKTSDQYGPDVEAAEREAASAELTAKLEKAIATDDANHLCEFSTVTDWDLVNSRPVDQRYTTDLPRRAQTLAEVLMDPVNGYPEVETALIQLLLNACNAADPVIAEQAKALRAQIANKWLEYQL